MKIVLATFGSRGDVQPMLALSLALQSAGHSVLLAGPPEKADWAEQLGCPYQSLGSNVTHVIDSLKDTHSVRSVLLFVRYLKQELLSQFQAFPELISGADLVLGASLVGALSSVAESMGIPYRFVLFSPSLLPSGRHPSPFCRYQGLSEFFNRMDWRLAKLFNRFTLTALINKGRKESGLRPVTDAWPHILGHGPIVASDKAVSEVPKDAKPKAVQTGYLHLDQPDRRLDELDAFLEAGPPPIYVGFGSMPKDVQRDNVSTVVKAGRAAGARIVIAKFWEGPSEFMDSDDLFFIHKYPHLKLFPRMAGIIHHGGAGTTAAAALCGVPQMVVPHLLDQYYWGHQVYRSGLGPKPIWRHRVTWQNLAKAIDELLRNHPMRQRAIAASRMINPKKSLEKTVDTVLDG